MSISQSFGKFKEVVSHGLTETHKCPQELADALVAEYEDVLSACWTGGITAFTVIKLLYAEWKTFRQATSSK